MFGLFGSALLLNVPIYNASRMILEKQLTVKNKYICPLRLVTRRMFAFQQMTNQIHVYLYA